MSEQTKKCPYCAEEILFDAKKCKHCGEFLDKSKELVSDPSNSNPIEVQVNSGGAGDFLKIVIGIFIILFILFWLYVFFGQSRN